MGATSSAKKAAQYLHVTRTSYGYDIYDKVSKINIAKLMVLKEASDEVNSTLRDAVVKAYFEYFKDLNVYK